MSSLAGPPTPVPCDTTFRDGTLGFGLRLAEAPDRAGVDSSAGRRRWTTVGWSANILEASCEALIDIHEWAVRHPLLRAPQSSTA